MSSFPYKIYCDMDGVLVDFETGVVDAMNLELKKEFPAFPELAAKLVKELGRNYVTKADIKKYSPSKVDVAAEYMYRLVEGDENFWANLSWQPGGKRLWAYIRQFDPDILTAPMDKGGKTNSLDGKLRWVDKNLNIDTAKVNFEHEKWKYATSEDGDPNILIDDFESKVKPWNRDGGIGILHLNADNTIKILDTIKNTHEDS